MWVDVARARHLNKMESIDKFGGETSEDGVVVINTGGKN